MILIEMKLVPNIHSSNYLVFYINQIFLNEIYKKSKYIMINESPNIIKIIKHTFSLHK
jgi:hypothetical protein